MKQTNFFPPSRVIAFVILILLIAAAILVKISGVGEEYVIFSLLDEEEQTELKTGTFRSGMQTVYLSSLDMTEIFDNVLNINTNIVNEMKEVESGNSTLIKLGCATYDDTSYEDGVVINVELTLVIQAIKTKKTVNISGEIKDIDTNKKAILFIDNTTVIFDMDDEKYILIKTNYIGKNVVISYQEIKEINECDGNGWFMFKYEYDDKLISIEEVQQ